jgi:hypothetical protein
VRRGKSLTPASRVLMEESRSARDSRREDTQPSKAWFMFAIVLLSNSGRNANVEVTFGYIVVITRIMVTPRITKSESKLTSAKLWGICCEFLLLDR